MRAVTTATAAAILQWDRKVFDNFVQRVGEIALPRGRQGLERRISLGALESLFLAQQLSLHLGMTASQSFALAARILSGGEHGGEVQGRDSTLPCGPFVALTVDAAALRGELRARYEVAVESVVRPRRGRPRLARRGTNA